MILPQAALVRAAKIGIRDNSYHIYGPKKYWLFGERTILQTFNLPGQMTVSDARINFGDKTVEPGAKLNIVMFDKHTYCGVVPHTEIDPNVWDCHIDHYRSRNDAI